MTSIARKTCMNVLGLALSICRFALRCLLAIWFAGDKLVVPPINNPILLKSGVSLASDIRKRKIKCEDVVKAYCDRIRQVNPYINAVCEERFVTAIKEAKDVDKLIESQTKTEEQLQDDAPLLGVPFTVKILLGVKGMACNAGSPLHKGAKAHEDADCVALMKKAGAICLAVTNSPGFGLSFETYNSIYGRTRNPYNTSRSAGGSSGGEGALIGAGGSIIGIGNDLGGSIRQPSYFNGIFGHKPTSGLISNKGVFPRLPNEAMDKYVAAGPMCRYAEDLALVTKILSCSKGVNMKFDAQTDFSKIKIYYCVENDGNPLTMKISYEIKNTIKSAAEYFQKTYGTNVEEIHLKEMKTSLFVVVQALISTLGDNLNEVLTAGKGNLHPLKELLKFLLLRSKLPFFAVSALNINKLPMIYRPKYNGKAQECLKKIQNELEAILDDNSVLFMPSFPIPAHYHYEFTPLLATSISYLSIFNILGFPATQCPIRLSREELPLGFQVVGAKENDPLLLSCALELEKAFGGWRPPNTKKINSHMNNVNNLGNGDHTLQIT